MTITLRWSCYGGPYLAHCDASGTGPRSDSQAARHTKATGHATTVVGEPQEGAK